MDWTQSFQTSRDGDERLFVCRWCGYTIHVPWGQKDSYARAAMLTSAHAQQCNVHYAMAGFGYEP